MTNFYRFPAMAKLKEWEAFQQIEYIRGEIDEAITARQENERQAYGMELLDVIHATETALRMELTGKEVEELQRRVIEKNRKRGYYMTNELEPCAYCGGEIYLTHGEAVYSNLPMFKCKDCGAVTSFDDPIPNAAMMIGDDTPAIEMFNTRYKRTCKMIRDDNSGPDEAWPVYLFICSACGESAEGGEIFGYRLCPNCGAEVVDGD